MDQRLKDVIRTTPFNGIWHEFVTRVADAYSIPYEKSWKLLEERREEIEDWMIFGEESHDLHTTDFE